MKKNRILLLITLALILIAVILLMSRRTGTLNARVAEFAVNDTASITKIFFADKQNNTVKLERIGGGTWKLNENYTANTDAVNVMLKTLMSIDVKAPVAKAARNNIIRLMAAKSVKVEVYQRVFRINLSDRIRLFPHEKKTKTYYVGDATQDNMGTYMLMEGTDEPCIVSIPGFRGFVATRYSAKLLDWRDHSIFNSKLPDIKQVSVSYTDSPQLSFSIANHENKAFTLTSLQLGKPVTDYDTLKVIEYLGLFRKLNFESFLYDLEKKKYDSITALPPTFVITVETKLGNKQTLKAWRRKAAAGETDLEGNPTEWDRDRMFARIEGTNELVTIQFFVFDEVLKPITWFYKEPAIESKQ